MKSDAQIVKDIRKLRDEWIRQKNEECFKTMEHGCDTIDHYINELNAALGDE